MADPPLSSPATLDPNSQLPKPVTDNLSQQPDPSSVSATPPPESSTPSTPNPGTGAPMVSPQPPVISSYTSPPISGAAPPAMPSFRPVQHFSPFLSYQTPGVPPPGVSSSPAVPPGSVPTPMMQYQFPPGQSPNSVLRPFAPVPNGYAPIPGLPRYPSPYPVMRPLFPPRPPGAVGVIPGGPRPPVGIPGVRPVFPPFVRPGVLPTVTPAEKPQTTVYIGKIAPTVDNDFMLSLLRICGPVKSWKRAQDPTDGTPRAFGFCEFESAEGVLCALRLLSKFNIDGQDLSMNVNEATKQYLEQYVKKKIETAKNLKEIEAGRDEKDVENEAGNDKNEHSTPSVEDTKKDGEDPGKKSFLDIANSGIVSDEDREADKQSLEKLNSLIEERLTTNPLPPPPALPPPDGCMKLNSEVPKSREGDSDGNGTRSDVAVGKNDDEDASDSKAATENDRPESTSPDHRNDRRSRDRGQDLKRENEREIERLERVSERERTRKERELKRKIDDAEREYEKYVRDWEQREKEKEKQRQYEKNREKERERKRKKEIRYDEEEDDDDSRKRWRRSELEEKRRKRLREKEEDLADRVKEEKEIAEREIAEAKKRVDDEQLLQQQREALRLLSSRVSNGGEKTLLAEESTIHSKGKSLENYYEGPSTSRNLALGNGNLQNSTVDESNLGAIAASDARQSGNAPARKLGFGLVGSGKRTSVPSVFHEEDDDAHKDKRLRPLVPIDYSTDEVQANQPTDSGAPPPNLAAAAEFAKRISNTNPKDEKLDGEREKSRHSRDKSSRDKYRNDEGGRRTRDREHGLDKAKGTENQKLFDAKQLIDMIPKTKEELFSYEVNWDVYDKHALQEKMRPWISKKIAEYLGEEEKTLVDYIVSCTQDHVKASQILEQLQSLLDEEAEMFVLKMWRMLIFEIKKVETGIALPSRT